VEEDETVAILYVFHGSQDIEHLFQLSVIDPEQIR